MCLALNKGLSCCIDLQVIKKTGILGLVLQMKQNLISKDTDQANSAIKSE